MERIETFLCNNARVYICHVFFIHFFLFIFHLIICSYVFFTEFILLFIVVNYYIILIPYQNIDINIICVDDNILREKI